MTMEERTVDRIQQVRRLMKMNQKQFANAIGMAESSLSSVLNGHTSPTKKLLDAILARFTDISIEWLMSGVGEMMRKSPEAPAVVGKNPSETAQPETGTNQATGNQQNQDSRLMHPEAGETIVSTANQEVTPAGQVVIREVKFVDKKPRKITHIHVYYDDGTFSVFCQKPD